MDLIYTDAIRQDVGVLKDFTLDLAFGSDENDFELTMDVSNHCCEPNSLVYIENTEYGGIIDGIGVVTKDDQLTYRGRTWQGILGSKVIEPDVGKAYLTVSGDANQIINDLFLRCNVSELFIAPSEPSGLYIDDYSFDRYTDLYSGIKKMVEALDGKLKFSFANGTVTVSALPAVDYSQDEQFDSDTVEMNVEKYSNFVNHLICLGGDKLEERIVIHLYVDKNGFITGEQTLSGLQELAKVYDYPNTESTDELIEKGMEKLLEYANTDKVQMDFLSEENTYDIGDIIGAVEVTTGTVAVAKITKKIVTIRQGEVNIQYKVGE